MSETISITINSTTIAAAPADVCVVYMGTVGEAENLHDAPFGCETASGSRILFEPGGSYVSARALAEHLADPHPAFKRLLDAGAFTVYATAAEALAIPPAQLAAMIRVTRHARTLREWLAAEEAREPKRRVILEGLRERLRINADHSTPNLASIGSPAAAKPKPKGKAAA